MHQGLEAAVFPAGLIALRRPLLAKCLSTLARLDVRVAPWAARWRDHFLLMTGLGVWDFRVNALISDRRGRNHALMLGWGRGPLPLVGSRWVFALRDGLLNRIVRITA